MSDLIVLAFTNETDAFAVRDRLVELQKERTLSLQDAAVVVRDQEGRVKVKQAVDLAGVGALGGAFWGMLIGLLFLTPWLGLAIGAVTGALAGKFTDTGIDDNFIKEVGATIQPGNSALFLLVGEAMLGKVEAELASFDATVLRTSLSSEDEARLRELLSAHDAKGASDEAAA
jgi:uncharacterized membrane protein